jgi:hypothetical protein
MTDQPGFTYWECRDCGFDAVTDDRVVPAVPICPLCAGDYGRDVDMHGRPAQLTDVPEGVDARAIVIKPRVPQ